MSTWLYKFAGTHEVVTYSSDSSDLSSFDFSLRMTRAHFILDLDTGKVIKDRYTGNTGHIIGHKALVEYRRQFGYHQKTKEHFNDDLFQI